VKTKITKILARDILEQKAKYVRKGYLIFDQISIVYKPNEVHVEFRNESKHLATMILDKSMSIGDSFTFFLLSGSMRMNIEGKS
jgi:hypothetical protein